MTFVLRNKGHLSHVVKWYFDYTLGMINPYEVLDSILFRTTFEDGVVTFICNNCLKEGDEPEHFEGCKAYLCLQQEESKDE